MVQLSNKTTARGRIKINRDSITIFLLVVVFPCCALLLLSIRLYSLRHDEVKQQKSINYKVHLPRGVVLPNDALPNSTTTNTYPHQQTFYIPPLSFELPSRNSTAADILWQKQSRRLPEWIRTYVEWHQKQLEIIQPENWREFQFLILRCHVTDDTCGGVSDRLKSIPLLLHWAKETQRIFLIHWSRPCRLEEFLLPLSGGLNWSVPEFMLPHLVGKQMRLYTRLTTLAKGIAHQKYSIICARIQDQHGGSQFYNEVYGDRAYRKVYRALFDTLFEPSPPVQQLLDSTLNGLGLELGQYAGAHVRAYYKLGGPHPKLRWIVRNSVNCASYLRPGGPVLFVSDSKEAVNEVDDYRRESNLPIVPLVHPEEPLHLDKADSIDPRKYYNVFVDLFLLAGANCIAHGVGGYGRFGVLLSQNASCFLTYFSKSRYTDCNFWIRDENVKETLNWGNIS